jgi:hypothetical protein
MSAPAPDLQELVARHGGYDKIRPEAWAKHCALAEQQERRQARLRGDDILGAVPSAKPSPLPCQTCGGTARFGYRDKVGDEMRGTAPSIA